MPKPLKAAILGGAGYGSAEMIRRLLLHPQVELCRVTELQHVGEPLSAAHPHLEGQTSLRFESTPPAEAAAGMDVVLLGLPHKVSAKVVPDLIATGVRIVDMSGDFRLSDAEAYARYYGGVHPAPALLGTFVYGLPELHRARIRAARHVASPGCFATTIELGLLPAARGGWLDGKCIEIVGITGSSGSGVAPSAGTHHPVRAVNLRTYKPLEHQHVPEILETLSGAGARDLALSFVPVSAPLSRGIFATCFVDVPEAITLDDVRGQWRRTFEGERFVRVVEKRQPEVAAVSGSNYVEVGFALGDAVHGRRTLACFSALDNLIKGGAGQAIQNMNLVLGLDEALSLEDPGPWP